MSEVAKPTDDNRRPPIWESEHATVVLDDDGSTTRHEDVNVRVHHGWLVLEHLGETQAIPRRRVEEVFERP